MSIRRYPGTNLTSVLADGMVLGDRTGQPEPKPEPKTELEQSGLSIINTIVPYTYAIRTENAKVSVCDRMDERAVFRNGLARCTTTIQ